MTAPVFLRHPAVLLAAVALTIGLVWYLLGRPVDMPPSPLSATSKLDCLSYAPVPHAPATALPEPIVRERINADFARLAPRTTCVRTYSAARGLEHVPEIANQHGLLVLQGIALGRDARRNEAEIETALTLASAPDTAVRAIVAGSEVLLRRELRTVDFAALLARVREETDVPVTYADRWDIWLDAPELARHVDFITIHVPLYRAEVPVAAADAARHLAAIHARLAAAFPDKEVVIGEVGWPSAGPMREAALPSPSNQARVLHEALAAARKGKFSVNLFEAFDQPWRHAWEGSAGAHWGLFDAEQGELKFAWGRPVTDHPLWFYQALLGLMLAAVTFAAGFLAARSLGPDKLQTVDWLPVAAIALGGGLFLGMAVARVPLESSSIVNWIYSFFQIIIGVVVPPAAAAASVRRVSPEGFAVLLNPARWRADETFPRLLTLLFLLTTTAAIQLALAQVFDPQERDIPFVPLTGAAFAFAALASFNSHRRRRGMSAELAAAAVLAGAALSITVTATVWNWQAVWFAAVLTALAWSLWRAPAVRTQ